MTENTLWVLVTASRDWEDSNTMSEYLGRHVQETRERYPEIRKFVLVHGACGLGRYGDFTHNPPRSDALAKSLWVNDWGFEDDPHPFNFTKFGRAGGPIRNAQMVRDIVERLSSSPGDRAVCEAFIKNGSSGASGCADLAERAGILTARHYDNIEAAKSPRSKTSNLGFAPAAVSAKPVRDTRLITRSVPDFAAPCSRCGVTGALRTDNADLWGDGACVDGCLAPVVPLPRPPRPAGRKKLKV